MTQIARAAIVLIFVAMAALLPFLDGKKRRTVIHGLIAYVLVLMLFMTITGRDAWPLATFPMMANDRSNVGAVETMIAVRAVAADGSEWEVDPLAWSPLTNQSIRGWFENAFYTATAQQRTEAARFLLQKAEWARRSRAAHQRFGNERILGALAAPDTYAYHSAVPFSPSPYVGIRVYRLQWVPATPPPPPGRRLLLELMP